VGDPIVDEAPDALISVYVEENLVADGFGIENAIRRVTDGVAWLSWA